tara:strand:- start:916 stop:1050 length:135 start_codon:yes stop_codon:yes gene_type:complete
LEENSKRDRKDFIEALGKNTICLRLTELDSGLLHTIFGGKAIGG